MENQLLISNQVQDLQYANLKELNDIFFKISDDTMKTLSQLFSIDASNVCSQKMYFQNIIIPFLYTNCINIKDDFLELIDNLNIFQEQIKPKKFFGYKLLDNSFKYILIKDEMKDEI